MPKKIVKGVGMMQREILQYELHEPGAMEAWFKAWDDIVPTAKPDDLLGDALDREYAAICKDILDTVGLANLMDNTSAVDVRPLFNKQLGEDSAQYLAAHWLGAYNGMMAQRQRLLADGFTADALGRMLMHSQEMGRLQERMWWRRGVVKFDPDDRETWKRREELALSGRRQVKGGHDGNKMKGQQSFAAMHGGEAQKRAQEIARQKPELSWTAIRGILSKQFKVSDTTLKNALTNPKKAGN